MAGVDGGTVIALESPRSRTREEGWYRGNPVPSLSGAGFFVFMRKSKFELKFK